MGRPVLLLGYLFESLQDLLPLAEMPEEQVERSGHQRRVVVHGEVQQDSQEGSATVIIQVEWRVLLAAVQAQNISPLQFQFSLKKLFMLETRIKYNNISI